MTRVGFGAGHIGDTSLTEDEAGHLLNALVDEGITLFDTARSYGLSEERIGRHLAHRRREIVLSTKVGYGIEGLEDWTGAIIAPGVERALRMLRTDVIDIVHLHSCPLHVLERGDVVEALARCVADGKVRIAGHSGDNEEAEWAARSGRFGAVQTSINLFDQRAVTHVLPYARGMTLIAKRPLGNAAWRWPDDEYHTRWQEMRVDPGDLPWDELALRFTLTVPGVSYAIVGSKSLEHMRVNLACAAKGPLDEDTYSTIRAAFNPAWRSRI